MKKVDVFGTQGMSVFCHFEVIGIITARDIHGPFSVTRPDLTRPDLTR